MRIIPAFTGLLVAIASGRSDGGPTWDAASGVAPPRQFVCVLFPVDGCTGVGPDGLAREVDRAVLAAPAEVEAARAGVNFADGHGDVARSSLALTSDREDELIARLNEATAARGDPERFAFSRREVGGVTQCTLEMTYDDGRRAWSVHDVAVGVVTPVSWRGEGLGRGFIVLGWLVIVGVVVIGGILGVLVWWLKDRRERAGGAEGGN